MSPQIPLEKIDIDQLIQGVKDALQFIVSSQFQEKIFILKIIFILISILFFLGILYFLVKSSWIKEAIVKDLANLLAYIFYGKAGRVKLLQLRWKKIKEKSESNLEAQQKLSLIEALQMFDKILVRMGYGGKNLAERLKKLTEDDVSNLKSVFEAVQVCQDIVRDPNYRLSKERAQEVVEIFEKALKDLQAF